MIIFTYVLLLAIICKPEPRNNLFPLLIPHNIELHGNFQCYDFRYLFWRKLGQYLVIKSPHHNTDNMTTHVNMHNKHLEPYSKDSEIDQPLMVLTSCSVRMEF